MDQDKIGKFIAECRKEKSFTQAALAEQLGITDRAVSKRERGKNMPDLSIMPDLCELLGISVNELLTGEHIEMEDYRNTAEQNLLELTKKGNAEQQEATFVGKGHRIHEHRFLYAVDFLGILCGG